MSFFGLKTISADKAPVEVSDFDDLIEDDRLGDQLEEIGDDLNDETFGGGGDVVGKDFDFAGQTAKVADTLDEEQYTFARTAGSRKPMPADVPSLQPIAALWGEAAPFAAKEGAVPVQPKMLSLEEVEAQMLQRPQQQQHQQQQQQQSPIMMPPGYGYPPPVYGYGYPEDSAIMSAVPFQQMGQPLGLPQGLPQGQFLQGLPQGYGQISQAPQASHSQVPPPQTQLHIPQGPQGQQISQPGVTSQQTPPSSQVGQSYNLIASKPAAVPSLHEVMNEDIAKNAAENERLLQKSRKTAELVKYNGLMSQWDKNFIMRIQLQQMVTEDPYNEDFYYQVHSAIQSRNNPAQPLNEFAKTYLFQRGQRGGRFRKTQDNRMQQQIQQAVQTARDHPKREQIAPEGALGKISVGSGKRPRRALNVLQNLNMSQSPSSDGVYSRRGLLRSIENVYAILLEIESFERTRPSQEDKEKLAEWQEKVGQKVDNLWNELQVLAPVDKENSQPFIMMLAHDKGMKMVPRIFRHINQKQRLTVLTRIVAHIDSLDVVKTGSGTELRAKVRESVELFSQTVLPPLVHLVSESNYDVVIGLLEIMLSNSTIVHVASTKTGLAFLTVLISRAELINQEEKVDAAELESWQLTFANLFNAVQGHLSGIFPPRNVDDSYVWHFLASLALAAKLEHQRIIVDEVRNKIFATMAEAKALPVELASQKIGNLNLFLNVMGLNATTTEISELTAE